jgi:hypothetical protein
MVRVLSILPFATGSICILLVLISMLGFASGSIEEEIPVLGCVGMDEELCPTGMTSEDLDVPSAFFLLNVELEISLELDEKSWIGIVDSKYAKSCPPDETGLTNCTASDYKFLAGGPENEGDVYHSLEPGSVRFVTGGQTGSDGLGENTVTTEWSVHLATWFSALLALVGLGLCASGLHMAFPMVASMRKKE